MAQPISTTSGKTPRARIAALRAQREPTAEEKLTEAVDALEAVASLLYTEMRAQRKRHNENRLLLVEALQTVNRLRGKTVDIPL